MDEVGQLIFFTLFHYFLCKMVFAFENGESHFFSVVQKVNLSNCIGFKLF